ncbi:MAG: heavy-metal-associated domain-containing protein [Flavobacterium sp.]|uniref:heavy-metal-associated domain-containing protein n=1 Tax=Flavobacterium sp. TaxID=239 RepID=UPI00120B136E|nr:heavy metal-associated domain-containing protein [Flavobacterium sp.]RZJ66555.1 MAG: heavy-metal-associated domain-containing protein [Flavobacterium sp.]
MNLRKSLLIAALPVLFLSACKQTESAAPAADNTSTEKTTAAVSAKPETASFKIDGMVCAVGCAKTIENKLAKMDGVTKATVDYDKKQATVEFDAAVLSTEKIVETVEKTGDGKTYKVSDVKSSGNQAMNFGDPVKEKDKKKKSKKEAKADATKKEGCQEKEAKGGCCAKKGAHAA